MDPPTCFSARSTNLHWATAQRARKKVGFRRYRRSRGGFSERRSESGRAQQLLTFRIFWCPCAPPHPAGPCAPLTHTPMAGAAQGCPGRQVCGQFPQLGCLEMIQGHPCQPQKRDQLLKPNREFEELLLYFYTFISLHFQQAGTAHLQNHLGKQKNGYFHKKLFPGEEAGGYPLPGVTNG